MLTLKEWRHYLIAAHKIFEVWTDHQNLQYFQKPQKIKRRQAGWLMELAQYHFTLHYQPGTSNNKPDFLSRLPGLDKGEKDNENVILLPEYHFCSLQPAKIALEAFPETVKE